MAKIRESSSKDTIKGRATDAYMYLVLLFLFITPQISCDGKSYFDKSLCSDQNDGKHEINQILFESRSSQKQRNTIISRTTKFDVSAKLDKDTYSNDENIIINVRFKNNTSQNNYLYPIRLYDKPFNLPPAGRFGLVLLKRQDCYDYLGIYQVSPIHAQSFDRTDQKYSDSVNACISYDKFLCINRVDPGEKYDMKISVKNRCSKGDNFIELEFFGLEMKDNPHNDPMLKSAYNHVLIKKLKFKYFVK